MCVENVKPPLPLTHTLNALKLGFTIILYKSVGFFQYFSAGMF